MRKMGEGLEALGKGDSKLRGFGGMKQEEGGKV